MVLQQNTGYDTYMGVYLQKAVAKLHYRQQMG
jgi:hypothetical protein